MNIIQLKSFLLEGNKWRKVLFGLPVIIVILMLWLDYSDSSTELGRASYHTQINQNSCQTDRLSGDSGASYGESTENGIKYNVRTPLNYDPTILHPLLLVFSPAGSNRAKTEKTTGLTLPATSAGFIIAYADHPELSPSTTVELGTIPHLMAKKWCIDEGQVYITGHSDGGTSAMALAFMIGTRHIPRAIAPSAAGITYEDLRDRKCPEPLSVMIIHSNKDKLFPGYGQQSAGWWASCNKCDPIPDRLENGCVAYTGCANGIKTLYCEGDQPHSQWPQRGNQIIEFFTNSEHIAGVEHLKNK
ncbi:MULTISPECIES: poly(3-hydroxybutyrate) depolymerase [Methylomonas]|uniref:Poly(3-hydroxybutyrate) depolymerase n=2 Tax=Methylomonas TaxID=416 RepID=A0A126T379_9GAMM|nr:MULTISPECIES: poly(3-hydroxybutyrate) depolymerase [Methylomonas]AMK76529.1 poly(3-hydroxybutyrate) depolymerase [Methylomonas denitrificans]OAH98786.1 poly(3-hydroxybutyrate) depolymerase [Methylomonas methanica]TCV88564.1 polyhydroxybutyrate depolymerase [Methylomonas methanica]